LNFALPVVYAAYPYRPALVTYLRELMNEHSMSKPINPRKRITGNRLPFFLAYLALSLVFVGFLAAISSFRLYKTPTSSMEPGLVVGDYFVVVRYWLSVERGDLVTFESPMDRSKLYVKRVVAVGGDQIQLKDGALIVNGKPVERSAESEPCFSDSSCVVWRETLDGRNWKIQLSREASDSSPEMRNFELITVPKGQVFLLGDSRDNSNDSRHFGTVPVNAIRGKPVFIYFSISEENGVRWKRIGKRIQ